MSGPGHVVLVGLPGSGKSTVGPPLAAQLGRGHVDTDADVEARLGRSVAEVFTELGEARFRLEEMASLERALASAEPLVVSAGGGLIAQVGAATSLTRRATVVWLDASDATLAGRAGRSITRPLLGELPTPSRLAGLRRERAAAHRHAHLRVLCGGATAAAVAARLATMLSTAVWVNTASPYLVTVAPGALSTIADHLPPSCRRALVIADQAVPAVAAAVTAALRGRELETTVLRVAGGEMLKRWSTVGDLLERCSEAALDRDDCIVAVGGGTVGDVAGLVAATYLRGIAWVVVPTTLLAMVDSSVGGKTAVNLARGKNLAGAFWQPRAVVCDPAVLSTMPERSYRSAFAEIVKSSMVGGAELPALLESRLPACLAREPDAVAAMVGSCCSLKAAVVGEDEREDGRRAILNYGHTVGHAVESLTGVGEGVDHGEAVAIGMRVAGALSVAAAGCPAADIEWQNALLDSCGLGRPRDLVAATIADRLGSDKKARGGVPRWVLLRGRGRPVTGLVLPDTEVRAALAEVCDR